MLIFQMCKREVNFITFNGCYRALGINFLAESPLRKVQSKFVSFICPGSDFALLGNICHIVIIYLYVKPDIVLYMPRLTEKLIYSHIPGLRTMPDTELIQEILENIWIFFIFLFLRHDGSSSCSFSFFGLFLHLCSSLK